MADRGDKAKRWRGSRPAEGVRILRAEEAQAALDAGEAAGRRRDDELRFGDVPPAPSGPRPAHRFPLPDSMDPARAVSLPPLRRSQSEEARRGYYDSPPSSDEPAGAYPAPAAQPAGYDEAPTRYDEAPTRYDEAPTRYDEAPAGYDEAPAGYGEVPTGYREPQRLEESYEQPGGYEAPRAFDEPDRAYEAPGGRYEPPPPPEDPSSWPSWDTGDRTTELESHPDPASLAPPEEGITVAGGMPDLPHWTDPPTGEVPRILIDDDRDDDGDEDLEAWRALGARGVRWRDSGDDWQEPDEMSDLAGDEEPLGILDQSRAEHSDLYSFDDDFERAEAERTG
jgi:hypothetical protein